jgi:hypothetical protein
MGHSPHPFLSRWTSIKKKSVNATLILLNDRRPKNVRKIAGFFQALPLPPIVILGDNSTDGFPWPDLADHVVRIPWNAGTYLRIFLALQAETEHVIFMDDDIIPIDRSFLYDAIKVSNDHPNGITGAFGRRVSKTSPHYSHDAVGNTEIVKGRFMIFRREILDKIPSGLLETGETLEVTNRSDDIQLSIAIGRGEPVHWVDQHLQNRLVQLDESESPICGNPDHDRIREEVTRDFLKKIGVVL